MGSTFANLYQTTNGGKDWVKITETKRQTRDNKMIGTIPSFGFKEGGITFINENVGWITGSGQGEGFPYLYKTIDGGKTWSNQEIPLDKFSESDYLYSKKPIFFNKQNGVLPFSNLRTPSSLYVTTNGGETWKLNKIFEPGPIVYSFPNQKTGYVIPIGQYKVFQNIWKLYKTTDGGINWSIIPFPARFKGENVSVSDIQFVTPVIGFLVLHVNGQTFIFKIKDGGKTWN